MSWEVNVVQSEVPTDSQANMNERRRRSQNFSYDEKVKLVKIVSMYAAIILSKNMDGATNEAKSGAWNLITARFNRTRSDQRPKITLMRLWHKIKTEAKIYKTMRDSRLKNPGRSLSKIKKDPLLMRVCEILDRRCTDSIEANEEINNPSSPEPSDDEAYDFDLPEVFSSDDIDVDSADDKTSPLESNKNDKPNEEEPTNKETEHNNTKDKQEPVNKYHGLLSTRKRAPFTQRTESKVYRKVDTYTEHRMSIQELKYQILHEELEFKRNLYRLQLESAAKEVEIKKEVLANIKSRKLVPQNNVLSEPAQKDIY